MKRMLDYAWPTALGLAAWMAHAQDASPLEQLQRQLQQLQTEFDRQQALQHQQLEALRRQIDELQRSPPAAPAPAPAPAWSPADPIRVGGSASRYLNLSLDGLFAAGTSTASDLDRLQPGGHDPQQRGFNVQNVELTLEGHVDPYFRGQANVLFQLDATGESRLEVEEVYLQTLALPGNLQLKAGQFMTEFGRQNPAHPHTWSFVDAPLVNARLLGPDGLRNPGARLSWLLPTPFYAELFLAVQNSHGETAASFRHDHEGALLFGRPMTVDRFKSVGDLLFAPRYAMSFDLTDTQTLLLGTSAALGPNGSGPGQDTQLFGVDSYWKWKPATHHGGFPFVAWQTEGLVRRFGAAAYDGLRDPLNPDPALPAETLLDYGFYSQLTYGFRPGWVAGLRGDWVGGRRAALVPDPDRDTRWRLAPNLTWYPSEFSKVRLQYNYDDRAQFRRDHSIWLQLEFLLGSHAAHKF